MNARVNAEMQPEWRAPAPLARRLVTLLYAWGAPLPVFAAAAAAALALAFAAILAPAFLSLEPTGDLLAPVAGARAVSAGTAPLAASAAPLQVILFQAADQFVEAPGRVHLVAKAIAVVVFCLPIAYFASTRFPIGGAIFLAASVGATIAAPYSASATPALGALIAIAICFLAAPADNSRLRALAEGVVAGALLIALWLGPSPLTILSLIALSTAPFLSGRAGLDRYASALLVFALGNALLEVAAPGMFKERVAAIANLVGAAQVEASTSTMWGAAGLSASAMIVIGATAVFGGIGARRSWAVAAVFLVVSLFGAGMAGAQAAPLFVVAAMLACFSTASPFYDGVFRSPDRASVALAGSLAALSIFWSAALIAQSAGQFALQLRLARSAPADIRAEFALVQPGGPAIARWIEEGRFSTPEAREYLALTPVDQSAMLLAAAAPARRISDKGFDVAILTGADSACLMVARRPCSPDGLAAAKQAGVVFVPRLDLDKASAKARSGSEALLYSDFRRLAETPLWDVWVRRGLDLPPGSLPL